MKKTIKAFSCLMIALLATGCFEDPGTEILLTDKFVSASVGSLSTGEGGQGTILVEISEAQSTAVDIQYNIVENNVVNGIDYVLNGTSVTIPAGEYSASITYNIPQNFVYDELPRSFVVEFTSVSASGVRVDGNKSVTVTLVDDDCPLYIEDWEGVYTVEEGFYAGVNSGLTLSGAFGESYQVELTADASDPLGLTGIWQNSAGFDEFFDPGEVMEYVACDLDVVFDGDPDIANFANLVISNTNFDVASYKIVIEGDLGPYGPYRITLTKQ